MNQNPNSNSGKSDPVWGPAIPRLANSPELLIVSPCSLIARHLRSNLAPVLGEFEPGRSPSPFCEFGCDRSNKIGILSHFLGAPAAAVNLEPFLLSGTKLLLLIGPVGAFATDELGVAIGSIVFPSHAISDEGTSRHYQDGSVSDALEFADLGESRMGGMVSMDAPYRETEIWCRNALARGARYVDMESSAVLSLACRYQVPCYGIFVVSDMVGPKPDGARAVAFRSNEFRAGVDSLVAIVSAQINKFLQR